MGKKIKKAKAEFLLNAIRNGGIHDLMQKEIIKTLYESGYTSEQMEYFLHSGKWPKKTSVREGHPNTETEVAHIYKKMIKTIVVVGAVSIPILLILWGITVFTGNDHPTKISTQVEERTDGRNPL